MAHELDFSTGTAAIAYRGDTPWHGYGAKIDGEKSVDEWRVAAGLGFELIPAKVYGAPTFHPITSAPTYPQIEGYKSLSRSDTGAILSVVSERYHVVQPAEVLEFFRDLTESHGYHLESAGALRGGRRFWALATTGRVASILGEDEIRDYLLLSSSCDGSLATTGQYTSIRVVCNNTLTYAVNDAAENADASARKVRVQHSSVFKPAEMKGKLAASDAHWQAFIARSEAMAKTGITLDQAVRYFAKVHSVGDVVSKAEQRKLDRLLAELTSGLGSDMTSARMTVWGLLNAVTHDVDFHSTERVEGSRQSRAWFGDGARVKSEAERLAMELVSA